MTFVFGGIGNLDTGEFLDAIVFGGSYLATGDLLVAGRDTDPTRPGEFLLSKHVAVANGLAIGDTMQLVTLTQADADEFGFDPSHATGPIVDAVLVGIVDGPTVLEDPTGGAVFSPALLADARIGTSGTVLAIGLDDGVTLDDFRLELDTIPAAQRISLEPASLISPEVRIAVRGQGIGLWVLAGIGTVVTIATLGQLLVRTTRLSDTEASGLASLGCSPGHLLAETVGRAAVVVCTGTAVAVGLALATSGVFPIGFVRRVEPDPGMRIDRTVVLGGGVAIAAALLGWVAVTTALRRRVRRAGGVTTVGVLASRCPTPAMGTGVRFALSPPGRAGGSPAAGLVAATLAVACLAGMLTFATSVQRLVDEPARYGDNYDFSVDNGMAEVPTTALEVLRSHPDIDAVTLYTTTQARIATSTIFVAGMEPVRGDVTPPVLAGRLPLRPDEIAIGRVSARALGLSIGDEVVLTTERGAVAFGITGLVIPTMISGSDLVGQGVILTSEGFDRIDRSMPPGAATVRLRPGMPKEAALDILESAGIFVDIDPELEPPPAIANLARVTFVPFALAALLAVLGVLIVANVLHSGVRRRDGQMAVLRSIGADRRWLAAVVTWQGVTSVVIPALIGAPLGFIAGRLVFRAVADNLGSIDEAMIPMAWTITALAALVVIAVAVALVAGHRARTSPPATLLRAG